MQYERNVLRGIRDFASTQKNWIIRLEMPGRPTADFIDRWQPDGILYQSTGLSDELLTQLANLPAAINLSESSTLRSVGLNNPKIGKQAAQYFINRHLKNFAFTGYQNIEFSKKRGHSFRHRIENSNFQYQQLDLSKQPTETNIIQWLNSLPKPCGLFATHDECALYISTLCQSAGIAIPDEIAVLGVDNDTLISEIAWPQLSSIAVPSRKVGKEAANMLSRILSGEEDEPDSLLLSPTGIVTRQSTDTHQTGNDSVNRALSYMDSHFRTRINIDDVLRNTGVSRRLLEKAFAEYVGRSPLKELQRIRIAEAKRLLSETPLSLDRIAPRCGCRDATQLGSLFKKENTITPGQYRKNLRR